MIKFDGSSYVNLPDNLINGFSQNETIEAWFQTIQGGAILGYQSGDEMMIGFFDVAVPANIDKRTFFERARR